MSDRCPKCGAVEEWRHSLAIGFECDSQRLEGTFSQTDKCRIRELEAAISARDATIAGMQRRSQEIIDLLMECRRQFTRGQTVELKHVGFMHWNAANEDGHETNKAIDAAIKELEQEDSE